jgi:hypothetical protein
VVSSLDHLQKQRGPVLHVLGEDLQQIPVLVVIDQDLQFLQNIQIFGDSDLAVLQLVAKNVVVAVGHLQELHSPLLQVPHRFDDVLGVEGDVLHPSSPVVLHVLLDLALLLPGSGLVNRELDVLLPVAHHDGPQRRVFGVDLLVVDGPKPVELEDRFVPFRHRLHVTVGLIPHHVVDEVQLAGGSAQRVESLDFLKSSTYNFFDNLSSWHIT